MELSERKLKILAAIVNAYIQTGEPVGSKLLALDLGVSSATVRNEMADLVEMGFLEQPHTSAGRVPSQEGYRVFVDRLMGKSPLTAAEKRYFDSILLARAYDPQTLMNDVSRLLADWTRMAAVATTPSGGGADVRAVQFVQTSRRTAMIILISSAGTMKNRVFRCDFDITPQMMQVFFRVVNERVARKPVSSITPAFIQSLAASLGEIAMLMSSALMALLEVAQDSMEAKVFLNEMCIRDSAMPMALWDSPTGNTTFGLHCGCRIKIRNCMAILCARCCLAVSYTHLMTKKEIRKSIN